MKKISLVCCLFFIGIGFFVEPVSAAKRNKRSKQATQPSEESKKSLKFFLAQELFRLKREGKNDIEIRVHIDTMVLFKFFNRNVFSDSDFLLSDENFIVENLIADLCSLGRPCEEIKSYLNTIYLMKVFQNSNTDLQELDNLTKDFYTMKKKEGGRFFIRIKQDFYPEEYFFIHPARWLNVTANKIYAWIFESQSSKTENSTSPEDLEELLQLCKNLKLED